MRNNTLLIAGGSIALGLSLSALPANAFSLFIDDRAGFNSALDANPLSTIVDSNNAFAIDPAAATGVGNVERNGSLDGIIYQYFLSDANFSNAPTGSFSGDITSESPIDIEKPATQSGATGTGSWGVDSSGGNPSTRNALRAIFTSSNSLGIGHFGVDLHDFESSVLGSLAQLRLYKDDNLVFSQNIDWLSDTGNGTSHFLGVAATNEGEFFNQLLIVLGDDVPGGNGFNERWAADNFTFGQAYAQPVPTPALLPGLIGFGMSIVRKKRKQQEVAA